jgi:hypothetical protein
MKQTNVVIEKMLTLDGSGYAKPPTIRQLQDKDVAMLWSRDTTSDKRKYLSEVGVIFYMGDPKSPPRQRGFSDVECLKEAKENYDLPSDYHPDALVAKLISKYHIENVTEAGIALESLNRSIHLSAIAATRINELLNKKLTGAFNEEEITSILTLIDRVNKTITEIPNMTQALGKAYENLRNETEDQVGRGKQNVSSSMDADEDD